jgi:hypothetical protein
MNIDRLPLLVSYAADYKQDVAYCHGQITLHGEFFEEFLIAGLV